MNYPPPNWQPWPPPSHHSPIDLEHRLTALESSVEQTEETADGMATRLSNIDRRLNLHEKAILGILGILQVLMQDKYPLIAEAIKRALAP